MRGFIACISLALFGIARATGRGCADPRYEYDDKKLVFNPKLKFYQHEYDNYNKIYITCKAGYYLYDARKRDFVKGNKFTSTCNNGEFDPPIGRKRFSCRMPDPECTLKKSKYRIDDPDKTTFKSGESVYFDCKDGYYLSGVGSTLCMRDGDFRDPIPTCKPKCKKPVQKYLVVDYDRKSFMTGGSIGLDCAKGYKLRKGVDQVRYCQDGEWDPEIEDDLCEREGCRYAPKLLNGGYKPNTPSDRPGPDGWFKVGAKIIYYCKKNYYLEGKDWMACARNGKFIYNVPRCIEIRCDQPMDIANGGFEPEKNSYPVGKYVDYYCDTNYKLDDKNERRFCRLNDDGKSASFESAPMCEEITCDYPMKLENGDFREKPNAPFTIGEVVKYECNRGYEFATDFTTSTCKLEDDGMSAEFTRVPICRRVYCTLPGKLKNGDISPDKDRYVVDESVTFTCDKCYRRDGDSEATCQQNGEFDNKLPSCDIIKCSKKTIPYPRYSTFRPRKDFYECGDVVEFECNDGYILKYDETTECQDDGTWSIDNKAECTPIICLRPDLNKNVRVDPNRKTYRYEDEIEYYCKPGYSPYPPDETRAICQKNGQFSKPSITCKENNCGQPPLPKYGGITEETEQDEYSPGDEVEYVCKEWYTLYSEDKGGGFNECEDDGKWKRSAPKCLPPSCKKSCYKVIGRPCQCDYGCYHRKDCCDDREKWCYKESCGGRCGKDVPGGCSCDQRCSRSSVGKCCGDYYDACPGQWYLG